MNEAIMTQISDEEKPQISDEEKDLIVNVHNARYSVLPTTEAARNWLKEHAPADAIWRHSDLVVEPRYALLLLERAAEVGLSILLHPNTTMSDAIITQISGEEKTVPPSFWESAFHNMFYGAPHPLQQMECDWPGCAVIGDPWLDDGWCWYPRKYLWLPEGFFCPEHNHKIQEMHETGGFDDWPLDNDPEVLEFLDILAGFSPVDSAEGREILAEFAREGFYVVAQVNAQ